MQHFFALQPKLYPVSHVRVSDHLTFYRTGGQAADNLALKGHHQQKQGVIEKAVQLRRDHAGLHYRHNHSSSDNACNHRHARLHGIRRNFNTQIVR